LAISVVVYQPLPGRDQFKVLAEATVDRGRLHVEGRRADLVDTSRRVYSERSKRFVKCERDPEEWLRSFAQSFRTAQVGAAITRDSSHRELISPSELIEQLRVDSGLATART
jgi:hypothetical protein